MKVALGSAFRNSAGEQIRRYTAQALALQRALADRGDTLTLVLVEGDSRDDTRAQLLELLQLLPGELVTRNHGGPVFGSTEEPARFRALQTVGNGILESVPDDVDVLVYVESDLIWAPTTILALIDRLGRAFEPAPAYPTDFLDALVAPFGTMRAVDVIAPLVFAGEAFYDIFAFRKSGRRFGPFPPYHPELLDGLTEIDSAGSCLVMRAEVARQCRIDDTSGLVSFCDDARAKGFHVWVDPSLRIYHP